MPAETVLQNLFADQRSIHSFLYYLESYGDSG